MSDFNFAIKAITPPADSSGNRNAVPIDPKEIVEDFAKMLISQITNQDPDRPMDATEIITQYSQMMNSLGLARMTYQMGHYELVRIAMSSLGKMVYYKTPSGYESSKVVKADFFNDNPALVLENGSKILAADILGIEE